MSQFTNGCSKIKDLLEPYFEGVLPQTQERIVAEHLWQCSRCAAEFEQVQRLTLALDSLPQIEPARELLAAISARLAALPSPAERRLRSGWRRLGLAAAVAFVLVGLGAFGLTLLSPTLVSQAKPVIVFVANTTETFRTWVTASYRSLLAMGGAAKTLWPATRALGVAAAPIIGGYAVAEVAFLAAAAWIIRAWRRRSMVPCHVGTRRS